MLDVEKTKKEKKFHTVKPSDSHWEVTSGDLTKHDGHIEIKWELESNKDRKKLFVFLPSPTVSSYNFLTKGKGTTTNKTKQKPQQTQPKNTHKKTKQENSS